jgi:hypothetical protein
MSVADGSSLRFIATDTLGKTATSGLFPWPPAVTPPPPGGPFGATYSVPTSVNTFWVEVKVTSTQVVSGVSATVNGGTAVPLVKQSWGNWAKSFFVAQGSSVRFTATNATGVTNQSQVFTWLGTPAPPGPYSPTFTPKSQTNNYWVEVAVSATRPTTHVEAQVNGGTWISLPATTWGTWAKSFFVADGALVKFRATDNEAVPVTVESGTYTWG